MDCNSDKKYVYNKSEIQLDQQQQQQNEPRVLIAKVDNVSVEEEEEKILDQPMSEVAAEQLEKNHDSNEMDLQSKLEQEQQEEQQQLETYQLYAYDFKDNEKTCQLLGSTGTRYDTTVKETLEQEKSIFQQKVNPPHVYDGNNHFRNAKWSPDGCCLLSNSSDNAIRLFNLPYELLDQQTELSEPIDLATNFGVREGEAVYDFAWFPSMTSQGLSVLCFYVFLDTHGYSKLKKKS
ncbi:hypothetical protein BDC45DRAFT_58522 [Circinella umbellata]|nr:hypothetical protein BDC45DRAFT_58522 [Circinella umbellata]